MAWVAMQWEEEKVKSRGMGSCCCSCIHVYAKRIPAIAS